ncbi:HlyD family secretion protein [Methylobacterium oxalidis]|uniref:HlyD family secretion protein n=1 Tax=Methylobacterium oxalidis TaxID=944322 RepID=UPI0033157997
MIRKLSDRTNADRFKNDVRANGKRYGRYVYMAAVGIFAAYLVNLFVGPIVWLQADGLVNSQKIAIASMNEAQVIKINVKSGDRVSKGEVIGEVHSPQVSGNLAMLANQFAETQAKQAELIVRLEIATSTTKAAEDRLNEADVNLKRIVTQRPAGFMSDNFVGNAYREKYLALQENAKLEAEKRSASGQLENLVKAQKEAREAIDDVKKRYNNGIIVSPFDGYMGAQLAQQGDVLKPGEYFGDLFVGEKHVLAYLPTGTLYKVKKGERVSVADGFNKTEGTLVDIRPISVQLPPAFQRAFRPQERGQVATITLDSADTFAQATKVRVTGHNLIPGFDEITSTSVSVAFRRWVIASLEFVEERYEILAAWIANEPPQNKVAHK